MFFLEKWYFHLAVNLIVEGYGVLRLKVFLKFFKRKFISFLILAVLFSFFLDGIVGQVNHFICQVLELELNWGCPDITFLVPVRFLIAVDWGPHWIGSDVKLAFVVQHGVVNVQLHYVSLVSLILVGFFKVQNFNYLLVIRTNSDALTSVCLLTRLHNPYVFYPFKVMLDLLLV